MTKKSLALLIVISALTSCENHVRRLDTLNKLADKNKQPVRFSGQKSSFWLFSVGEIDMRYEVDANNKWFVNLL